MIDSITHSTAPLASGSSYYGILSVEQRVPIVQEGVADRLG